MGTKTGTERHSRHRAALLGNRVVAALLQSPLHRVLSGSVDLIRYTGRRTGREITTPTQYAQHGKDVVILVGRPETKTWWRNFTSDRAVEVLVRGRWTQMTARVLDGRVSPDAVTPLLDVYLERFPRAARSLDAGGPNERARRAVVVWCRPR